MNSISRLLQNVSASLRLCLYCVRPAKANTLLCEVCDLRFEAGRRRNWVRFQSGVPILSLYNWHDSEHPVYQRFAQSLKGGGVPDIFANIAADISEMRLNFYPQILEKNILNSTHGRSTAPIQFVPAPGRSQRFRDHAEELAFQLAKLWGGQYCAALARKDDSGQKKATAEMRWRRQRVVANEISIDRARPVVFIDDVLTTGSTATMAYRALGRPEKFEIWTVFYRPRLRAFS